MLLHFNEESSSLLFLMVIY